MSTTRTDRCPHGLAGTCSICRTGFTPATVYATLALELGLVWMLFLPRRWRIVCFFIVTPVADWRNPDRELHVPELPGSRDGGAFAG